MNPVVDQFSARRLHALLSMFQAEFIQLVDDLNAAHSMAREGSAALTVLLEKYFASGCGKDPALNAAILRARTTVETQRSQCERIAAGSRTFYESRISVLINEVSEISSDHCSSPLLARLATLSAEADADYTALAALNALFAAGDVLTEARKAAPKRVTRHSVPPLLVPNRI